MQPNRFHGPEWERRTRIQLIEDGPMMRLLVNGRLYMHWHSEDDLSPRITIVQLSAGGMGTYQEIAEAFRIHEKSVYNYIQSFSQNGAYNLVPEKSGPKGSWKLNAQLRSSILFLALNRGILDSKQIKTQLDDWGGSVSVRSIRRVLLEN